MLSPAQVTALEARIGEIERAAGVQVVTALVARSDAYPELAWKAFALGVAVGASFVVAFDILHSAWTLRDAAWSSVAPILAVGGASAVLALLAPAYARLFLNGVRSLHAVRRRAQAMFLERHLFTTRKRTGVLLFASAFERRVEIVADIGFDGRIDERDWRTVIDAMTPALRQASAADAFARGLDRAAALLAAKGFRDHGERNELPDRPIVDERGE